jgi:hypothetical protein
MAGLVPAIHDFLVAAPTTWMLATSAGMTIYERDDLNERIVQVAPFGIFRMYEAYFPRSRPAFDRFFALNGQTDVVVRLAVHENL